MLWYRYNFFSDGIVHACLFSGIVSYFLNLDQIFSMMIVATTFACLVFMLKFYSNKNAVVGLVSSAFLATSIILASKLHERAFFDAMLFGDIFTIEWNDFYIILFMLCAMFLLLIKYLDKIVMIAIDPAIAKTSRISINYIEFAMLLYLALIISVSIKLIGAFLIGSLLIIPAIGAKMVAKSPLHMIILSVIISIISGICGFYLSLTYDMPLSPSISIVSVCVYVLIGSFRRYI